MQLVAPMRHGELVDAPLLAELVNCAGEGMPLYLWGNMAEPGETAWDVGRRRAVREDASFSYLNAVMIEHDGQAAGCLVGYEVPHKPEIIDADTPAMFVPLIELENLVPSTWYVNVLAVVPNFRGHGLGTRLLGLADDIGRELGKRGMSIIVADKNTGARRLYERNGYAERAARPVVKEGWKTEIENWVLMTKEF